MSFACVHGWTVTTMLIVKVVMKVMKEGMIGKNRIPSSLLFFLLDNHIFKVYIIWKFGISLANATLRWNKEKVPCNLSKRAKLELFLKDIIEV